MKNKKVIITSVAVAVFIIVVGVILWYVNIKRPYDLAVKDYNTAVDIINNKNAELDEAINKLQGLIDSAEKPLDNTIIDTSKEVIKSANTTKTLVDEMPQKTDDIIARTAELSKPVDYSETLKQLNDTYNAFDISIKQYKQLTNPSEDFVIQRLQTIDEVAYVQAVTEDNDPNGKLNKEGGYTATVYFESKNVNQSNVYGTTLLEKCTDAGGAVEVYANEEDAIKRDNYLAVFDGGIFSSGSHKVVGTIIVRTSNELTATQQKALEEKVISALSELK